MGRWAQGEYGRVLMEKVQQLFEESLQAPLPASVDKRFSTFIRHLDPSSPIAKAAFRNLVKHVLLQAAEAQPGPSRRPDEDIDLAAWSRHITGSRAHEEPLRLQNRSGTTYVDIRDPDSPERPSRLDEPEFHAPRSSEYSMPEAFPSHYMARSASGRVSMAGILRSLRPDAGLEAVANQVLHMEPEELRPASGQHTPPEDSDSRAWLAEYTSAAQNGPTPSTPFMSTHLWHNSPIWRVPEPDYSAPAMRRVTGSRSNLRSEYAAADALTRYPRLDAAMSRIGSGESLSRGRRRRYEDMLNEAREQAGLDPLPQPVARHMLDDYNDDDWASVDGRRQRRRLLSRRPVSEALSGRDASGRDIRRYGVMIDVNDVPLFADPGDRTPPTHVDGPLPHHHPEPPRSSSPDPTLPAEWINFGPII